MPQSQRHPVLRTFWGGQNAKTQRPLIALEYGGRNYRVTDAIGSEANIRSRWNCDVLRLLVQLSSLVSVDISRFQNQVLELR